MPPPVRSVCCGLLVQKVRWGLSWKGWLALFLGALVLGLAAFHSIHPFLAVTSRVEAHVLAVEGWIPDCSLQAALEEFSSGTYTQLVVAIPWPAVRSTNSFTRPLSAPVRFFKEHLPKAQVHEVRIRSTDQDRTWQMALSVRDWIHAQDSALDALNIVTEDVHARRTRLLYQRAFGSATKVGIIAAPPEGYEPGAWWRYSEGAKEIIGETIGYLYARFFFSPGGEPPPV